MISLGLWWSWKYCLNHELIIIMLFQSLSQLIAATHWGYDARKMAIRNSSGYDEASWTSQINKVYIINDVQINQGRNWVFTNSLRFHNHHQLLLLPFQLFKGLNPKPLPSVFIDSFYDVGRYTVITDEIPKNYLFLKNHFKTKMAKGLSLMMINYLNFIIIGSSAYATKQFKEQFV